MRIALPAVKAAGIPNWLAGFLISLRAEWQRRMVNGGMERAVTFQDLVDLGLATEAEATKQAAKK